MPSRRGSGRGTIRQLPSGRWQARVRLPNSNQLRSPGYTFDTKLDAETWLSTAIAEVDAGKYTNAEATTRRHRLGLRYCQGCGFDYRPSRANNVYCDDCTFNNARRTHDMRRARATGTHTPAEWADKVQEYGGLCAYCKTKPGTTKDHVIPVSAGGSDAIDNIVPACRPCNSRKGARLPSEIPPNAFTPIPAATKAALTHAAGETQRWHAERDAAICQARAEGATLRRIAQLAGLTHPSVIKILAKESAVSAQTQPGGGHVRP